VGKHRTIPGRPGARERFLESVKARHPELVSGQSATLRKMERAASKNAAGRILAKRLQNERVLVQR